MTTYPIFLVGLERKRVVVLGGGAPAERKVAGLLEAGARPTVIAPELTPRLADLVREVRIAWLARAYRSGDLRGAFLTISTKQPAEVNHAAWREAEAAGTLINVEDDVEHCNFIAGSIVRQGELTVAISTGGAAPALAVRLRERLARELGPEYGELLRRAAALRAPLAEAVPDFAERRRRWYTLVDSDVLEALREGDEPRAAERLARLLA